MLIASKVTAAEENAVSMATAKPGVARKQSTESSFYNKHYNK